MTTNDNAAARCPINGLPARVYCRKGPATYYIEPTTSTIFQARTPSVVAMSEYADQEYSSGAYQEYAKARDLKIATAKPRLAMIKSMSNGKRLLDVGCATGFFLEAAKEEGFDVQGVEFSPVAISFARPDIRKKITQGDVNALFAHNPERFDVVTAFDIIEHVQDPVVFLQEIRDSLNPGGTVALSTPDTGHFLRYVMGSRWPMLQPMQHTFLFSRKGMRALLESAGFSDIKIETTRKVLTIDYLANQLVATNPMLHRIYQRTCWIVPARWRHGPIAVNIGEFAAYARRGR